MNKNSYLELPGKFYQVTDPQFFENPKIITFNKDLAKALEFSYEEYSDKELISFLSGQKRYPDTVSFAQAYAGHQFGYFVPQLGDGRAHIIGELSGHDIQLKGSGRTKFSRRGDGKSALGPVIREYLISEALHFLGVPTTRTLCAISTGEKILRQDGYEPGGILARVAKSHIRVGTFQYFASQEDLESIKILLDYSIKKHFSEFQKINDYKEKSLEFLKIVATKQGELIAKWSSLGFIHGVMNTDNCSIGGITIDYGPCAFMDKFKFHKVFSSIDRNSRYSFFNQVPILGWNLARLAECFIPLIDNNMDRAINIIHQNLSPIISNFSLLRSKEFAKKLGIKKYGPQDDKLVMLFLSYLEDAKLDFTISFRNLPELFSNNFSLYPEHELRDQFLIAWRERVDQVDHLNQLNPAFIPRNHWVQKCIDKSYKGDYSLFLEFNKALKTPYQENEKFMKGPRSHEVVKQTFCGT